MKLFALLSAIALAVVSGYFSVYGLVHIFSLSLIPVIVMGTVLEVSKVATALFIHKHWKKLGAFMKAFLLACTLVLAALTSTGIFAFLAKNSQSLAVQIGTQQSRVDYIDERLAALDSLKKEQQGQLQNLNGLVGIYSKQEKFANARQATGVYTRQQAERRQIQATIKGYDKERLDLVSERLVATNEMRKTEVDVGPAVYVAQAIYGKKDINSVESAIRIIIFMIIFAFDPLAICLMLAIQKVYGKDGPEPTPPVEEIRHEHAKDITAVPEPEREPDPVAADSPVPLVLTGIKPGTEISADLSQFMEDGVDIAEVEHDTFPDEVGKAITEEPRDVQMARKMLEKVLDRHEKRNRPRG